MKIKTIVQAHINHMNKSILTQHFGAFHKKQYNEIINVTQFLPETSKYSERLYCIINDISSIPTCFKINCEKQAKFRNITYGYTKYCSQKCKNTCEISKKGKIKKLKEKAASTSKKVKKALASKTKEEWHIILKRRKKTRDAHTAEKRIETLKRRAETISNKYANGDTSITNISQTEYFRKTFTKTLLDKYGVTTPMHIPRIKEKALKNRKITDEGKENQRISRYRNTYERLQKHPTLKILTPSEDFKGGGYDKQYQWKCTLCDTTFNKAYDDGLFPKCPKCSTDNTLQKELYTFIKSICDEDILYDTYNIVPISFDGGKRQLDIIIPTKKIAFEFNGLYWHSDTILNNKNYHLLKTQQCAEQDYTLFHIFEDEWLFKKQIVKSRIKHILRLHSYKIFARKCTIKEIDSTTAEKFNEKYHIQGYLAASIRLGLFYRGKLVSVMTFRKHKKGYELSRYCTIRSFSIIGGAGKLLSYFEKNYEWDNLHTYADKRWSTGNLYKQLGFRHIHDSTPNYFYWKHSPIRLSRLNFQKHKLQNCLENYDETLTEYANILNNGYYRVWDCGNMVFTKKRV